MPSAPAPSRVPRWLPPLELGALAALFAALARFTAGRRPDPVIDAGRELYTAWRLAAGERLYADVACFNGPLSAHANALAFRLFGSGIETLVRVDLAVLAIGALLFHRLLSSLGSRTAAFSGSALFLGVFAFGQYGGIPNYDFAFPYSHEATHGLVLSLGALLALGWFERGGEPRALLVTGCLLGLVFLTKAEVFLAAALGIGAGLARALGSSPREERRTARALGVFVLGCALPPLAALLGLALRLPFAQALHGVAGAWPYVLEGRGFELPFYRAGLGVDDVGRSLRALAAVSGAWVLALAPGLWAAVARGRGAGVREERGSGARSTVPGSASPLRSALFSGAALALGIAGRHVDWLGFARPLPLVALAGVALALRRAEDGRGGLRLAFAVFALALLGKLVLNARVAHYGFTLALPAAALAVLLLVDDLPRALELRGRDGSSLRAWVLGLLVAVIASHVAWSSTWLGIREHPLGEGRDRFLADERALALAPALAELERRLAPDATLCVLPEGAMLNYLLRRRASTRYLGAIPSELAFFGGEEVLLEALRASPPDAVALVHRDASEYGARAFGVDYGRALSAWVDENYRTVRVFGAEPFSGDAFGVAVLVRR